MGKRAQKEGKAFEEYFEMSCNRQGFAWIKIPVGARIYGRNYDGSPKWKLTRAPFDYSIAGRLDGVSVAAYLDTKSINDDEFPRTLIDWDQVNDLQRFLEQGHPAGYLIHFRAIHKIVYIDADKLLKIGNFRSLKATDGIDMGDLFTMDIKKLWSVD